MLHICPMFFLFAGLSFAADPAGPLRVEYVTPDGVVIVGDFWSPDVDAAAPVAILLHMYNTDRRDFEPLVPVLCEAGFAVLAIDVRGHGESIAPESLQLQKKVRDRDPKLFRAMDQDVCCAYRWLTRRRDVDLSRLAIVGASVGASVALRYAASDRSVDVLVLMTPGRNYLGLNSERDIKNYQHRPVLMLTSEEERRAADVLAAQTNQAELRVFDQQQIHGTRMFSQVPGIEQTITDYLIAHIGNSSQTPVYASINSDIFHQPVSPTIKRIKHENLRVFSNPQEARTRGLRPAKR